MTLYIASIGRLEAFFFASLRADPPGISLDPLGLWPRLGIFLKGAPRGACGGTCTGYGADH